MFNVQSSMLQKPITKNPIPKYVIAIDGPAGSGKSTIAKILALELGFLYIDSGAMYRAVTLYMIQKRLLNLSERKLLRHIKKIDIRFGQQTTDHRQQNKNVLGSKFKAQQIFLNRRNVTKEIRASKVNSLVSEVSALKAVREEMVKRQKEFGKYSSVVMDGRDIGTVVFPDADLKIYLTASSVVRARRRKKDLKQLGENIELSKLIAEIEARDNYDSSRSISPLTKAQDSIVIDSSNLTIEEVISKIKMFLPA